MCEFHVSIVCADPGCRECQAPPSFHWFISDVTTGLVVRDGPAPTWLRAAVYVRRALCELHDLAAACDRVEDELTISSEAQALADASIDRFADNFKWAKRLVAQRQSRQKVA